MVSPALCPAAVALLSLALALPACGSGRSPTAPTVPSSQPTAPSGAWTLVFSDEFDQDGQPDASKWGYELGYIRNNEAQFYTSAPERQGREREPGDRGAQGGLPGLRVHVREPQHARPVRVPLRARRGAREDADGNGRMAGDLDARREPDAGRMAHVRRDRHHGERRLRPEDDPRHHPHRGLQPHVGNAEDRDRVRRRDPWSDFHVYAMEWYADRIEISVDRQVYFTFKNDGDRVGAHVAVRQAAVPAAEPGDRRLVGRPEGDRRLQFPASTSSTTCGSTSSGRRRRVSWRGRGLDGGTSPALQV